MSVVSVGRDGWPLTALPDFTAVWQNAAQCWAGVVGPPEFSVAPRAVAGFPSFAATEVPNASRQKPCKRSVMTTMAAESLQPSHGLPQGVNEVIVKARTGWLKVRGAAARARGPVAKVCLGGA